MDTTRLITGFRYIKELLLQSHNSRMYKDHQTLRNHNIDVYSVKTDAFTIDATNVNLVKSLLKFNNNMGAWRVSSTDDVSYTTYQLNKINNLKIMVPIYEINKLDRKDDYD